MKKFDIDKIRNVGIIAHSGAGKTSLIESMLYNGKTIETLGSIDEGNTVSDYAKDEISRKMTINCSLCVTEWKNHKLNLIDTPGAEDFQGDLESVLRVVDAIIFVVDATAEAEGGAEKVWDIAKKHNLPCFIFVNKMDKENSNFDRTVEKLAETLELRLAIAGIPIGAGNEFSGVTELTRMESFFASNSNKIISPSEIPSELRSAADEKHEQLVEMSAETSEELIEKYFDQGELSVEDIFQGLNKGISHQEFAAVTCGSALQNIGVQQLMDMLIDCSPSPDRAKPIELQESELTLTASTDEKLSAIAFKTMEDPFAGRMTFLRIYSGTLKSDSQVFNSIKGANEKIGKLSFVNGNAQEKTSEIDAGDFGVVLKLANTQTGDTLCELGSELKLAGIDFPKPTISVAIKPAREGDDEKLSTALQRMSDEDPTFQLTRNETTRQMLVSGLGDIHLTVVRGRMKDRFNLETTTENPKVAYRETIKGGAENIRGRLKKQSGGRGQFGEVWINLEPMESDENYEFVNKIVGGSVPRNYIPAVEKGIQSTMAKGVVAGYPLVGLKVTLYDGKHHPVDSSDMAFQIAGSQALREAVEQSSPVLLEPVMDLEVTVPEQFLGDVIGDLNSKRGRVMGVEQVGKRQMIKAQAPLSEVFRYAIDLKSITRARGSFAMEYSHYEQLPGELTKKVVENAQSDS